MFDLGILIPITALSIPITAIYFSHKQKVEQIRAEANKLGNDAQHEIDAIRTEMKELKELVYEQAIQMDTLITEQRSLMPNSEIQERLSPRSQQAGNTD